MLDDSSNARLPRELEVTEDGMAVKWKLWKQTFDFYSTATQLSTKPKEVQAATFMSAIGPAATIIYNTFYLNADDSKDLKKVTERFDEYFSPKPNEIYTRYLFFNLMQGKLETFDSYLTKLKTKVNDCSFGTLQDSLLRDQIVRGISSDKVRELLLAERDLTFQKAIDICRASEQATNQLKEMHSVTVSNEKEILTVRKVKNKQASDNVYKTKFDSSKQNRVCWRCGLTHEFKNCPAYNVTCKVCSKKGHYARQCREKVKHNTESRNYNKKIHELKEDSDDDLNCESLHIGELLNNNTTNAWFTSVKFNDCIEVKFKLDTGAEGNVITKQVVNQLSLPISKTSVRRLKSFNYQCTPVLGKVKTVCKVENKPVSLKFLVVDGNYNCILGCKTCDNLGLIKRNINVLQLSEISAEIPKEIFQGIGCIKDFEYDIEFEDNVAFSIHLPRRIPYALRDTVKKEIELMVKMNILKPVTQPTPAVSPLVIVKSGDRVRLCLDPTDINKVIKRRHFPLKTVEDIAARIGKAKFFTLLDAKKGFWQLKVTKRTSEYLTMNTPWGRFSFLRVPFGLASAPEIFQQVMQNILKNFENVECSMDDILLWANTEVEMKMLIRKVIKRLLDCGVRLNKDKCQFCKTKVKFLGHLFTSEGIEIGPAKVSAIKLLKTPTCLSESQRFIGIVNYVSKFIPNYSTISEPLRRLLQKNVLWDWSKDQDDAFLKLKEALQSTPKLAYYDVNKPVVVSVDASSHAIGAVLLQEGRPIAYSTKALTPTQKRYQQIEKEALAIRHGCKKFHDYIYGKSVVIETDHKPLESIFKKPLQSAPPRLQRLLFDVLQYSPKIVYKQGKDIPIPDALNRDCKTDSLEEFLDEEIFEVTVDVPFPISLYPEILSAVNEDTELQQLKSLILNGWPATIQEVPQAMRKYWNYRDELSVYENLLFKSERLIIPKNLQNQYLKLIHQGHLGITLSLRRACEIVFWHGMSRDIITFVQECPVCQQTSRTHNTEP